MKEVRSPSSDRKATTATDEDAALVIHEAQCVENEHGDHCIFWEEDHQSAQALADAGLLARPTPSRDDISDAIERSGIAIGTTDAEQAADAVLDLLEGGTG